MNTDQLSYLIEVSKHSSLNLASQKLHITPQALSMAIKKLEDEMGFELLNRSFKGISLTTNGEWLVREASCFLEKIEERKEKYLYQKNQRHEGTLNIAINYSGINDNIVGQLIGILYEEESELKIVLNELAKEDILTAVHNQEIEFGFIFRTKVNGNYIDMIDSDLNFEPLLCGDLILATAQSSEIAKFNSITLKKAIQYPLCVHTPQAISKDFLYDLIVDVCLLSPTKYEIETSFSLFKQKILRGIANSLSVYFPTETYPNNYIDGTKIVQLRDDIKIYFGFIEKRDRPLSNNGAFFLQELRGLIHDLKYPEK